MYEDVAIAIITANGWEHLKHTIPLFIKHSPGARIYLVYNDYKGSDTPLLVRKHFPEVSVIETGGNPGFGKAYNYAIFNYIMEDYIAIVNHDLYVTEGWLEPLIQWLKEKPEHGVVQPKILDYKRKDHFEYAGACGGWLDALGFPFARGRILNTIEKDEGQYDSISYVFWASGACMVIKRDLFVRAGGFNEHFFMHMEEIDLCWRLQRMGYKVGCVPQSIVYHYGGAALQYNNPLKVFFNFFHNHIMLKENLPMKSWLPRYMIRLSLDFAFAFSALARGEFKVFWAVIKAHLKFLKNIVQFRYVPFDKENKRWCGYYRRFILWDYYVKGKKTFSQLEVPSC